MNKICGHEVSGLLAEGMYGKVYETLTGLAIKEINIDHEEFPSSMMLEMSIISSVNHVNILPSMNISLSSDKACIIMKRGEITLKNYIKTKKFSSDEQFYLTMSIIKAVEYLHSNYILHLDLHTANILMFEEDGILVPKIIDFGLSRYYINKVIAYGPGHPHCPPDILIDRLLEEDSEVGPEVDNWSLANIVSMIYQSRNITSLIFNKTSRELLKSIEDIKPFFYLHLIMLNYEHSKLTVPRRIGIIYRKLLEEFTQDNNVATLLSNLNYVKFCSDEIKNTPGEYIINHLTNPENVFRCSLIPILEKYEVDYVPELIEYPYFVNNINNQRRLNIIEEIFEQKFSNMIDNDSLYLSIELFDKINSVMFIDDVYLSSMCCIYIATSILSLPISLEDLNYILEMEYSVEELNNMVIHIIKLLNFKLFHPTAGMKHRIMLKYKSNMYN